MEDIKKVNRTSYSRSQPMYLSYI